ncbi:MAG: O-antigen ligase [Kiritimatiellia bacterium]|jgi:O-antigen ligase
MKPGTREGMWGLGAIVVGLVLGVLAFVGPTAALVLLGGSIAFGVMVRYPATIVPFVFLGIAFANSGVLSVKIGIIFTTAKLTMIGGLVAWFVHAVVTRKRIVQLGGVGFPLALALASMLMAFSWARNPGLGTVQEMLGFGGLIVMVLFIDTIMRPEHLNPIHRFFAVFMLLVLLYDMLLGGSDSAVIGPHRSTGVFDDPNFWCAFLLTVIPPILVSLDLDDSWWSKALMLALLGLTPMSVIMSLSRGGFITMVLVAPFVIYVLRRRWPILLGAAVGGVLVALVLLDTSVVFDRYITMVDAGTSEMDGSIRDRTLSQLVAWDLFVSSPFFGWGTGSFSHETMVRSNGSVDIEAHNTYVRVLAEQGIIGAVTNLSVLGYTSFMLYRSFRDAPTQALKRWTVALAGSFVVFLLSAGLLNMIAFGMSFFYLGIIAAVSRFTRLPVAQLEAAGLGDNRKSQGQEPSEPSAINKVDSVRSAS